MTPEKARADFDRLALLMADDAESPQPYDGFLLEHIPRGGRVLDVGCGTGAFTRRIAARAASVVGVDFSAEAIRLARARTTASSVSFVCGDFMSANPDAESFDAVVSVATLHHLPAEAALERMRRLVQPGEPSSFMTFEGTTVRSMCCAHGARCRPTSRGASRRRPPLRPT